MDAISYNLARRALEKPAPPYSAIVCKDGSTVWAEDASGKTIASGESGVDDASVIRSALDVGGDIILIGDYTIKSSIVVGSDVESIKGINCNITQQTTTLFQIQTSQYLSETLLKPELANMTITQTAEGQEAIKITDSSGTLLRSIRIISSYANKGIVLENKNYWTEHTKISDCYIYMKGGTAIEFRNSGSSYKSFATTYIEHTHLTVGNGVGVKINSDCAVGGSRIIDSAVFTKDGVAIYIDGIANSSVFELHHEASGTSDVSVKIGGNFANTAPLVVYLNVAGNPTILDDPSNLTGGLVKIYMNPSAMNLGSWGYIAEVYDDSDRLADIIVSANKRIGIRHRGDRVFIWDLANDRDGVLWLGDLRASRSVTVVGQLNIPTSAPSNPTAGSMYFDPSTGTLYIYDGSTWKSVSLT